VKKRRPGSGAGSSGRRKMPSSRRPADDEGDDESENEDEDEAPRRRRGGRDDDEGGENGGNNNTTIIMAVCGGVVLLVILGALLLGGNKEEREPEPDVKPPEAKKVIEVDVAKIQKLFDEAKGLYKQAEGESDSGRKVGLLRQAQDNMKDAENRINAADERVERGEGIAGSSFGSLEGLKAEMGRFSTVLRKGIAEALASKGE